MHRTTLYASALLALAFATAAEERPEAEARAATLELGFLYERHFGADRASMQQQARWVSESDLVVALQLRRLSRTDLDTIIGWRREGSSWDSISRRCGLRAHAFYVELPASQELRGPYVRPYSLWRQTPGADLRLTDEEVRELALLRTLRDYCDLPAAEVVRLRLSGRSPETIAATHGAERGGVRSSLQPTSPRSPEAGSRKP
jgi:hypothetical protein